MSTRNSAAYQLGRADIDVDEAILDRLPPELTLEEIVLVSAYLENPEEMVEAATTELEVEDVGE